MAILGSQKPSLNCTAISSLLERVIGSCRQRLEHYVKGTCFPQCGNRPSSRAPPDCGLHWASTKALPLVLEELSQGLVKHPHSTARNSVRANTKS